MSSTPGGDPTITGMTLAEYEKPLQKDMQQMAKFISPMVPFIAPGDLVNLMATPTGPYTFSLGSLPSGTVVSGYEEAPAPEVSLDETEQQTAVRAWKRVRVDCPQVGDSPDLRPAPLVRSRYSKKPFIDLERAACMKVGWDYTECGEAPGNGCTCGYYGWVSREFEEHDRWSGNNHYSTDLWHAAPVTIEPWAEVDFYGKVVEHTFGYRAEYQRIVAFHLDAEHAVVIDGWGFRDFNQLASWFGAPIVYNGNEYK